MQILDLLEKIETEFQKLDVGKNLNYFLAVLFLKESLQNEIINEIEKRAIEDLIHNSNDGEIMNLIKKEFKKIKIEGKRDLPQHMSDVDENKTYFVKDRNRSRYDAWKGPR